MTNGTILLPDGRLLGYALYGPVGGKPVLYFHGTPSSRLEPLLLNGYNTNLQNLLEQANVRLIAVDRPGMGLSTINKKGDFLSFAEDVAALLRLYAIRTCPVIAWSGGGPFALAAAHQLSSRIEGVYIICGFARKLDQEVLHQMGLNKWYFRLAHKTPWLLATTMNILRKQDVKKPVPQKFTGLPYVDYVLMNDAYHLKNIADHTMKEASRNGAQGPLYEAQLYFTDFGFHLEEIRQTVHYWWGSEDMSVIRLHPEEVERRCPDRRMYYRQHEGHLSLYVKYMKEVLEVMRNQPAARSVA